MTMHIHAQIQYWDAQGMIHSDLCAEGDDPTSDKKWRELLHTCLDEWLDSANNTGYFTVGTMGEEEN